MCYVLCARGKHWGVSIACVLLRTKRSGLLQTSWFLPRWLLANRWLTCSLSEAVIVDMRGMFKIRFFPVIPHTYKHTYLALLFLIYRMSVFTLSFLPSLFHSHSLSCWLILYLMISFSLPLSLPLSFSPSLSLTLSFSPSPSLSLSLSLCLPALSLSLSSLSIQFSSIQMCFIGMVNYTLHCQTAGHE